MNTTQNNDNAKITAMKNTPLRAAIPGAGLSRWAQGLLLATAFLAGPAQAGDPELPVNLGTAGDFAILAKTGISNVPYSAITGDMGVSPITATAITGFSMSMDASTQFSTSAQVNGKIYAADYMNPTPAKMTTAISDMETAYTNLAGRPDPDTTEFMSGDLSGQTMNPGLHKWGTGVLINADLTLDALGNADAIFIFQIAGDLTMASNKNVILSGGAQAKNIFWQVGGGTGAVIGTYSHFEGVILTAKAITVNTGASFVGKLLAQTRVNLDQNNIMDANLVPGPVRLEIVSAHGVGTPPVGVYFHESGATLTNAVTGVETVGGTRYVNTGWTMTGNEPFLGTTNTMEMVIVNDAVLTWQWDTLYLLTASADPIAGGVITGDGNGFYPENEAVSVTATANPGYTFTGWTGHTGATPTNATQNLVMTQPRTLVAHFVLSNLDCGTPVTQGALMELDLSNFFSGTGLTYVANSSQPAFMTAQITAENRLRLVAVAPGLALITVTATDASSVSEIHSFPVTVLGNPRVVSMVWPPHEPWNPRFEQRIVIENDTGISCPAKGIRLLFSDLQPGIVVENQTGLTPAPDGRPMMEWISDFPNGATQEVSVVYLSTGAFRPDQHPPTVEVQYILANERIAPADQSSPPNIESIRALTDGRVVLEFLSVPGRTYQIDHAPSLPGEWVTVPLLLTAGANRTQWIDYGPPATPPLTDARFYRVREVTP